MPRPIRVPRQPMAPRPRLKPVVPPPATRTIADLTKTAEPVPTPEKMSLDVIAEQIKNLDLVQGPLIGTEDALLVRNGKAVRASTKQFAEAGTTKDGGGRGQGRRAFIRNLEGITEAQASAIVALSDLGDVTSDLAVHIADAANPHAVTATQVGLGNANNTSDANKPVSTAQQTALDLKFDKASVDTDPTLAANSDTLAPAQSAVLTLFSSIASGQFPKLSVRVKSVVNGTLATAFANGQTVNGVVLATNDRILIAAQTDQTENGGYFVNAAGAPTRALDMDTGAELVGAWIPVIGGGTTDDNTIWICTTAGPITLGVTNIVFTRVPNVGAFLAGTGLILTGSTFSINIGDQAEAEAGVSDKILTILRGAQQLQNFAWLTTGSTLARSNKNRWSDTVYVMDHDADPTGVAATFHTAYAAAFAEAQARNRSEIRLPSGILKLGGTCSITNPDGKCIRTIGTGIATRLVKSVATGNWFDIGAASPTARTLDLVFEGMRIEPNTTMTAGTIFNLRNTSGISFVGVPMKSVLNGYALGVGATVTDDVVYTDITDSPLSSTAAGTGVMISLGSGGILNIKGRGRWNGIATASLTAIKQVNADFNWDGLYVYDQFFEDFDKYLNITGQGISNLMWVGGQCDGFGTAFDTSNMASGALCQHWQIRGVQFLFGVNPLVWANGSGDARDCQFHGNLMANVTSYVWIAAGSYGSVVGNTFHNPGAATPLVRFGGKGIVNSNISLVTSGTPPTFGIQWDGASDSDRSAAGNEWDGAGADVTGTV